jgi:hypothetical protein
MSYSLCWLLASGIRIPQLFLYIATTASWAFRCIKIKWVIIFCELLKKNTVIIEVRPFGPSAPSPLDRPFVPHTLMPSHWEPWFFTEVPECPQTQAPNILWAQEKRVLVLLYLKVAGKRTPSRFPKGAPMERDACFQCLPLHILLCSPVKEPNSMFPSQTSHR